MKVYLNLTAKKNPKQNKTYYHYNYYYSTKGLDLIPATGVEIFRNVSVRARICTAAKTLNEAKWLHHQLARD